MATELANDPRPGKCRIQNRAIERAEGEIIVCLDDDLVAGPDYVVEVERFFDKHVEFAAMKGRTLPAEVRAQLTATGGRFAAAAQENAEALRIGGAATRLLLQMVIESVEAQRRPLSGYTARLAPTRATSLLAVALDRHL